MKFTIFNSDIYITRSRVNAWSRPFLMKDAAAHDVDMWTFCAFGYQFARYFKRPFKFTIIFTDKMELKVFVSGLAWYYEEGPAEYRMFAKKLYQKLCVDDKP